MLPHRILFFWGGLTPTLPSKGNELISNVMPLLELCLEVNMATSDAMLPPEINEVTSSITHAMPLPEVIKVTSDPILHWRSMRKPPMSPMPCSCRRSMRRPLMSRIACPCRSSVWRSIRQHLMACSLWRSMRQHATSQMLLLEVNKVTSDATLPAGGHQGDIWNH